MNFNLQQDGRNFSRDQCRNVAIAIVPIFTKKFIIYRKRKNSDKDLLEK